jgi:hypothetical protein
MPKPAATPAEEDPFAPATPAPATPASDDPFAPAAPAPAAPAPETPAPSEPAPAPAATPASDDPFAPAAPAPAAPAPETPAPAEPVPAATPANDDPFAPPAPAPAAAGNDPLEDPFKISAEGYLPMRVWADDTGGFKINGRLIAILEGKVRILKETGRTTTVPLSRLSETDREYVDEVIGRYGKDLDTKLAAR